MFDDISFFCGVTSFNGNQIVAETSVPLTESAELQLGSDRFRITSGQDGQDYRCTFECIDSRLEEGRFFVSALLPGFRKDWFVFIPSACYDGNRFRMICVNAYPPRYFEHYMPEDPLHPEIVMREIPSIDGEKLFNRSVTDGSAPLIGVFMPERKRSFFLALEQGTVLGDNGIEISIREDDSLQILLSVPRVRREVFTDSRNLDPGASLKSGRTVSLAFRKTEAETEDIASFYRVFSEIRSDFPEQGAYKNLRSFSYSADILRKMFEEVRYLEKYKFFKKSRRLDVLNIGWVAYQEIISLYQYGNDKLKQAVFDHVSTIFDNACQESGFIYNKASIKDGVLQFAPSNFPNVTEKGSSLVRVQAEFLYYTLKFLMLLERQNIPYPEKWKTLTKKTADAFVTLYRKYGQPGTIINIPDGEMVLGGSFSGALIPAALLLASEFYAEKDYVQVAEEITDLYVKEFHKKGFTYGAAGDAMFAPDSESASALLTSLVLMAENHHRAKYLPDAEFCADYFASWVPAIRYSFPAGSAFDLLDMDCRGAVQANLQNQHGAPAPCVDSANSLLLLYRMTGKEKYLDLLKSIIHNCVQYISTADRPIPIASGGVLPEGDISEKVYFQDYSGMQGDNPTPSGGWTECAVLMCITENPGIYCCPENDVLAVFDHVNASLKDGVLTVENPFGHAITVRLIKEDTEEQQRPLGALPFLSYKVLSLAPRETVKLTF